MAPLYIGVWESEGKEKILRSFSLPLYVRERESVTSRPGNLTSWDRSEPQSGSGNLEETSVNVWTSRLFFFGGKNYIIQAETGLLRPYS